MHLRALCSLPSARRASGRQRRSRGARQTEIPPSRMSQPGLGGWQWANCGGAPAASGRPVRSRPPRVHAGSLPSETGGARSRPCPRVVAREDVSPDGGARAPAAQSDNGRRMERVWRRVQSAGRRGGDGAVTSAPRAPKPGAAGEAAPGPSPPGEPRPRRRPRGPQTIVCGCQVQPCPVHPVLIRVRRNQRPPPPNCDCPPEQQPCPHAARPAGGRRARRYSLSAPAASRLPAPADAPAAQPFLAASADLAMRLSPHFRGTFIQGLATLLLPSPREVILVSASVTRCIAGKLD